METRVGSESDAVWRFELFGGPRAGRGEACVTAAPFATALRLVDAESDARWLAALPTTRIALLAGALERKRLRAVGRLLPRTRAALGTRFAFHYREFARLAGPAANARPTSAAKAFAAYLHAHAADAGIAAPTVEIARYEAAWLRAVEPKPCCVASLFRSLPERRASWVLYLWVRLFPRGRVWHAVLPLSLRARGWS